MAAEPGGPRSTFVTLGTVGGPIPNARRSEPANLLIVGDQYLLIDAGDGAAEQLARAGVSLEQIHSVFLSHLHFDHTGGLFAILGLRYQTLGSGVLTVYGPPGTRALVVGLIAAMQPAAAAGVGFPGQAPRPPAPGIQVNEITDGSQLILGQVRVTAAVNTHYSFAKGSAEAAAFQSLSLRFDVPDRSIVYTGDTGPSDNVVQLAHHVDLLVSEVVDAEDAMATLQRINPRIPPAVLAVVRRHMLEQHLTPEAAGALAAAAGVGRLVLTHNGLGDSGDARALAAVSGKFKGPIVLANDLDRF
jgi:ribonuclease BN (tRNA processing enzyme)